MRNKTEELEQRADLISAAIATISLQIKQIEATGKIAPPGCCVLRYQARGKDRTYWYYKLHATDPIFPTKSGEMSKYKHLGKGGSPAHIEAKDAGDATNSTRRVAENFGCSLSMLV
jgi:hypothetical protein